MKYILAMLVAIAIAACTPATPAVDLAAAENAVKTLFDEYGNNTKARNTAALAAAMDENGLFLGTDPGEFWSKKEIMGQFETMMKDTAFHFDFTLQKREIRVSPDGTTAVVIEQAMVPFLSKRVPIRNIGHAKIVDGKWLIDFYSYQLAPVNADLLKLDAALAKSDETK